MRPRLRALLGLEPSRFRVVDARVRFLRGAGLQMFFLLTDVCFFDTGMCFFRYTPTKNLKFSLKRGAISAHVVLRAASHAMSRSIEFWNSENHFAVAA